MKVLSINEIKDTKREVKCPKGDFTSFRMLLDCDGMGFSMTKTVIKEGITATWHYKHHLEACYCISGKALLVNNDTQEYFCIEPDVMYALDKNDNHTFMAIEETVLICIFNPPLTGLEVHKEDGSYAAKGEENE